MHASRRRLRHPCLATQLVVPRLPAGMVDRPRLTARLERGRAEPVTLVCAPAGSGKTSLVASTVPAWPERVAWVSLEPSDNAPERFWNIVLVALERAGVAPPGSALAELAAPLDRSEGVFAPLLVNALAELPEPVALVFDDLQYIRSRPCLAQLSSLLVHLPGAVRLVLIGRSEPPLPLHRLRLSGRLVEIRGRDLAFTEDEAAALLQAHGLDLGPKLIRALRLRTEGWSAGLRLAALGLRGHADPEAFVTQFAGDDRTVADYLLAEVLDQQPPPVRSFLLRTCLLDTVCGELADALTGAGDGADTLAALERSNAFITPCDGRGEWYRFHTLFARVLRTRAHAVLGDEVRTLRRRAADWYAAHARPAEALKHAVLAEAWEVAAAIVATNWFELYTSPYAAEVIASIAAVPEPWRSQDPVLAGALACAALDRGDGTDAHRHLADAERAAASLPDDHRERYRATLALARLATARMEGRYETALEAADELLAEPPGRGREPSRERRALVRARLGETAAWAERFDRAEEQLSRAIAEADGSGLDQLAISARGDLAYARVLAGGPASDLRCADDALALAARRGWVNASATASAHIALAVAALDACRDEPCRAHLDNATVAIAVARRPHLDFALAHTRARLAGTRGHPVEGLRELEDWEARHTGGSTLVSERVGASCLRARLHLLAGRLDDARAAIDPVLHHTTPIVQVAEACLQLAEGRPARALETFGAHHQHDVRPLPVIERGILEAVAHRQLNDAGAARVALDQALTLSARTGCCRPFVDFAGVHLEGLLRDQIRAPTPHHKHVIGLLGLLAGNGRDTTPVAPVLEPLSDREQVVLRYLPTNLSNREIAGELFLTTNTVKTHLRSIYRKLNVGHRGEAVARARELHLIGGSSHPGPRERSDRVTPIG
ncbi:LuxR C-terminal-related transcriptional regulator [Solirubrobacter pauli]|uniref:LuxR C-terminal-related transcriptional regulator n=1 Tax=Solirubrobacter pauli TaxID=166793 RepID=UPI0011C37877|nr:LuxR C-terminal-related transcriptional regulator [Solirubrobacter pauli]